MNDDETSHWLDKIKQNIIGVCPYCDSSNIRVFDDESGKCDDCKKAFSKAKIMQKSPNEIPARSKESDNDNALPNWLGQDKNISSKHTSEKKRNKSSLYSLTGYYLMILGGILYFLVVTIQMIIVPDFDDLASYVNYSKIMTIIGFLGILAFIFGTIVQMREIMDL